MTNLITRRDILVKAANFCAYQERTHAEVRERLQKWEVWGDEAEEIIAYLIEDNFLNEERFAKIFAGSKFRVKQWTAAYEVGLGIDIFTEYFIFSPSIRGMFGITDELIRDNTSPSAYTDNIDSMKSRAILINFTFH